MNLHLRILLRDAMSPADTNVSTESPRLGSHLSRHGLRTGVST